MTANQLSETLKLAPLPLEGGLFNESYRSGLKNGVRDAGTCIYYMLARGQRSFWHAVASDEIWLYHGGAPCIQILLFEDGGWEERVLGIDLANGQQPQSVIPANTWQATVPMTVADFDWSLFSAVVVPGFDFDDYTPGDPAELMRRWPDAASRINQLGLDE